MPANKSIKKVLIIGSGPIVIGQAAEFDYSGTQACRAFKEEGIQVVLVNSNPATIMTDKEMADFVYIEPLTFSFLEKIIAKEKPDSLLAGMGGQTALNLAVELYDKKILEKYDVKIIGTSVESIKKGEDRDLFRNMMNEINEPVIDSDIVTDSKKALEAAERLSYPVVVRPAYTMGGSGGGIANSEAELLEILSIGLELSPVGQVLIEKSIKGWKEIEYEVMRDHSGNKISVCNMENFDPVGIHTGDSIVTAPSQTLTDKEYQMLRTSAFKIIDAVGIKGGCNVQFALNPESFEYAVIEINPRVSRSSALASKATGYPIAKVAAKIAIGYDLDEIKNDVTKKTYACFEPSLDYVVVKIPTWPFDKFLQASRLLGTKMTATGEVMAIGSNFEAALLKAVRSLEMNQHTLFSELSAAKTLDELKTAVINAEDTRLFDLSEMIRRGYDISMLHKLTMIDGFFLSKLENIIKMEEKFINIGKIFKKISATDLVWDDKFLFKYHSLIKQAKKMGFSDYGISNLMQISEENITSARESMGIYPSYKMVDTCAAEFDASSSYYYSTYDQYDEVQTEDVKKVIIIGSGPIRIGQGIEFDYSCVHCSISLGKLGVQTVMINNNPETVSTDFDISDRLYFEPLVTEDVMNVIKKENPLGVILQFGGQTALKLAKSLEKNNVKILGTSFDSIDIAEDRDRFDGLLESLDVKRPLARSAKNETEAIDAAEFIGYPVLIRPSYVIGGQGMRVAYDKNEAEEYIKYAFEINKENTVLIDKYLMGKEIEVDALCDGKDVMIPGIMEHLERAGVHSGDSITVYPPFSISDGIKAKIYEYTSKIAIALNVKGMINIQFVEFEDELYVIEVNPRASRTVPYISKVSGVPIMDIATQIIMGASLKELGYQSGIYKESKRTAVKIPVFSTHKLSFAETALRAQMQSTGEVLAVADTLEEALFKGFIAAGKDRSDTTPVSEKNILVMLNDKDKSEFLGIAKDLETLQYKIYATKNTFISLKNSDINSTEAADQQDILDMIKQKKIDFIVNTVTKGNDISTDGFKIRRLASEIDIQVFTSLDTLKAMLLYKKHGLVSSQLEPVDIFKL